MFSHLTLPLLGFLLAPAPGPALLQDTSTMKNTRAAPATRLWAAEMKLQPAGWPYIRASPRTLQTQIRYNFFVH